MSSRLWNKVFARSVVWVCLVCGAFVLLIVANATWNVFQKERVAVKDYEEEAEALTDLMARKASLEEKLSALNTERGIEGELRERFPVAKAGEELIVVVDQKEASFDSAVESKKSMWERFFGWLGF